MRWRTEAPARLCWLMFFLREHATVRRGVQPPSTARACGARTDGRQSGKCLLMARARRGAARTWDEVSVGGKGPGRTQGTFGRFDATTLEGHVRITSQHISHNTSHRRNLATCRPPRNLSCNTSQYLAASRSPFRILSQPLVPEGWTFGRRDTNFGGSSTSHHTSRNSSRRRSIKQSHNPSRPLATPGSSRPPRLLATPEDCELPSHPLATPGSL